VEVLHADGGIYPACVNAATLALVDAGIPLKEYVCACTASLANNDVPMLDISHQEEIIGGPTLTVAALPMSGKIVLMEMSQRFHMDHLQKVLDKALQGCKDIKHILDEAVRSHIQDVGSSTGWAGTT
jgi:exosome complex component RRP41